MFVVRLTPPNEKDDFKVFAAKSDAQHHFWSGWVKIEDEGATAARSLSRAQTILRKRCPQRRLRMSE